LKVLYVARPGQGLDPTRSQSFQEVQKALALARELGADVVTRESRDVADTIVRYANEVEATQIVLGESTRSWLRELLRGSITRDVLNRTKDVDVHIVQRAEAR
jgi:two-component system sensor histidine kinase KdpD